MQTDDAHAMATHYTNWRTDPGESTCGSRDKTIYNIAVYAAATNIKRIEFTEETVRGRYLRTKAFFCGMETSVQMFSSQVLSQWICCPGAFTRENTISAVTPKMAQDGTPICQGIVHVM